jgi:hypothetical protein
VRDRASLFSAQGFSLFQNWVEFANTSPKRERVKTWKKLGAALCLPPRYPSQFEKGKYFGSQTVLIFGSSGILVGVPLFREVVLVENVVHEQSH